MDREQVASQTSGLFTTGRKDSLLLKSIPWTLQNNKFPHKLVKWIFPQIALLSEFVREKAEAHKFRQWLLFWVEIANFWRESFKIQKRG